MKEKRSLSSNRNLPTSKLESSDIGIENSQSTSYIKSNPTSDNIKVVIRMRPPLERELYEDVDFRPIVLIIFIIIGNSIRRS